MDDIKYVALTQIPERQKGYSKALPSFNYTQEYDSIENWLEHTKSIEQQDWTSDNEFWSILINIETGLPVFRSFIDTDTGVKIFVDLRARRV